METQIFLVICVPALFLFILGVKIVRSTQRGLIERLGKYRKFAKPGLHWIVPFIDEMYKVNTTEQMVDAPPQKITTNDNLNLSVYTQVYFRVLEAEESVRHFQRNMNDLQIINLVKTTLRNIIGKLPLTSISSERGKINTELFTALKNETSKWGIQIVRTELILI
jgi:regulator of protease activity HflC (stomatin/prohibitin superfamily)